MAERVLVTGATGFIGRHIPALLQARGFETHITARGVLPQANGITAQHLYDYVDDLAGYGEPSYDQAHAIELVRRDYFHNAQNSRPSVATLDPATLPAKSDAIRGISWLPRLLPKARAKLRGELPPALMYGCGGDRAFFKQHQILPHEFLNLVWRFEADDHAVIDWVARRATRPPT